MLGISNIFGRKRLRRDARQNERRIYPVYDNLKSIIFLFTIEREEDIELLYRCCLLFAEQGLDFSALVHVKKRKLEESARRNAEYDITLYGRKALTLSGIPKQRFKADLAKKSHDLLINFNEGEDFAAKYLSATLESNFTVAMREERDIKYDLVVSAPGGGLLDKFEFAEKLCFYLKNLAPATDPVPEKRKPEKGGEDEE